MYNNIILLKDVNSSNEKIDLVIMTNETVETIEKEIADIKAKWYNEEVNDDDLIYSLADEIASVLLDKYDCDIRYNSYEIYY